MKMETEKIRKMMGIDKCSDNTLLIMLCAIVNEMALRKQHKKSNK